MKRPKHGTAYLLLLLALLSAAGCNEHHRRPAKIYIPDGYVGWVRMEYDVQGAPALETDFLGPWEYQRFPPSGLITTSSTLDDGMASADYFYYSGNVKKPMSREMIQGGLISWCVKKPDGERFEKDFLTFFVGPKEEYEKHRDELERFKKGDCRYVMNSLDDLPKVGNLSGKAKVE